MHRYIAGTALCVLAAGCAGEPTSITDHAAAVASIAALAGGNGDFESGDVTVGWSVVELNNAAVTREILGGNHVAQLAVGDGPLGDASCSAGGANNFAALSHEGFATAPDGAITLDFLVPLPATADPTEDATCLGFDRAEFDMVVEDAGTGANLILGVVTVDYVAETDQTIGQLFLFDFVSGSQTGVPFDPAVVGPAANGALSIDASGTLPGWRTMTLDLSALAGLPANVRILTDARNEDNGRTGQQFIVRIDNLSVPPDVLPVSIDIAPGSDRNPVNCRARNGVVPVAILTTADFDATTVDASTVRFGPAGTEAAETHSVGSHAEDVDGDGDSDLLFHFRVDEAELSCDGGTATLTGLTLDGAAITGSDTYARP